MIEALEIFSRLFSPPRLPAKGSLSMASLVGAADAFLAATLATKADLVDGCDAPRVVLALTPGLPEADRLADDLQLITAKTPIRVLEFPPLLEGERSSLGTRLKTLAALKAWPILKSPVVLVVSYPAFASPVRRSLPSLQVPGVTFSRLVASLAQMGYERKGLVEREGDYSVRGGIVDVWSPGDETPLRLEFFGEEIESLRTMDVASQRSTAAVESAELLPVKDAADDTADAATLIDFLPPETILLALEHNAYPPVATPFPAIYTGDPAPARVATYRFQSAPLPGFADLAPEKAHHPELFEAAQKRLESHLAAAEARGEKILRADGLSLGFEVKGLLVVTKADRVFAKRTHERRQATQAGVRLNDFDDLEPGEYVVHVEYGVGRYIGSSEILVDGERREVFTIEYADGAKLHVPADHAHLLSRYVGVRGESVPLHRLDGKRWAKDRREAQKAVTDLAAALLETQAKRESAPGFAYDVDCDGRAAFDAAFPYEETPDQKAAIEAVMRDLASTRPMDRLVCGDAGYGKTEIAMRAAFVAAMNGKQVAVLAPTTILAEQHFETFASRFDGTPVRIESMSRFQSKAAHEGTMKRLAAGVCDIVIGTHALLSARIAFHDLGLIIVDEEQRFGVRHKEFLKGLRAHADVLTLSATPIPRTLYLSMTGARDLSVLRTPPRARVAVETKIVRDADETIRAAIEAEIARGGQVFFLHNRVTTIGRVKSRLEGLFKGAATSPRIVVAHGQMETSTLAEKMRDFERGKYDLLLSTTIIESGIDIPRANTILVDHAEMFGMADLYQLRGRVGRSSRAGFAYFLLPASGDIDSDARERLTALKRHGGLGAGFNLAVRDLELRGAGNLLGSQQSGHIAAIGFTLYCQLLKRTIARLKGEKVKEIVDVKLNLDFVQARLSSAYIEEEGARLSLMKRFAEAQDAREVNALKTEMRDRFGPLPPEAETFVHVAKLRCACAAHHVTNLDVRGPRAVFYKDGSRAIDRVIELKGSTSRQKLAELERALD